MTTSAHIQESLAAFEDLLVQEFRTLQNLINLTRDERQLISKRDVSALMQVVEQKESVLDQFNLMEDTRRNLIREISLSGGFSTQTNSLAEILPHLDPPIAARLGRLNDGISILANQARDLNHGNKVMATSILEWLSSTQAFLFRTVQPEINYRPPSGMKPAPSVYAMDVDHRI